MHKRCAGGLILCILITWTSFLYKYFVAFPLYYSMLSSLANSIHAYHANLGPGNFEVHPVHNFLFFPLLTYNITLSLESRSTHHLIQPARGLASTN